MLKPYQLFGKKVTAIGSCGMGKGVEITGILEEPDLNAPICDYTVLVTDKNGWQQPYSVYYQSIKEVKE